MIGVRCRSPFCLYELFAQIERLVRSLGPTSIIVFISIYYHDKYTDKL